MAVSDGADSVMAISKVIGTIMTQLRIGITGSEMCQVAVIEEFDLVSFGGLMSGI